MNIENLPASLLIAIFLLGSPVSAFAAEETYLVSDTNQPIQAANGNTFQMQITEAIKGDGEILKFITDIGLQRLPANFEGKNFREYGVITLVVLPPLGEMFIVKFCGKTKHPTTGLPLHLIWARATWHEGSLVLHNNKDEEIKLNQQLSQDLAQSYQVAAVEAFVRFRDTFFATPDCPSQQKIGGRPSAVPSQDASPDKEQFVTSPLE